MSSCVTGLEVVVAANAGYHLCRPIGELDASTAETLREAATALAGLDRVIIDLQDVPFIDSAGLAVLIGAVRRIRDAGGDVAIACQRPPLRRLLHTAGLDRLVAVAGTIEAAAEPLLGSAGLTSTDPGYPTSMRSTVPSPRLDRGLRPRR